MANLSLANRALIALITVFVMVFGVITSGQLKQELVPSITFPQAIVVASYPGAGPQVVEEKVTVPLEQAVLSLQGVESSESTSTAGSAVITVTMQYGSNMASVQQEIQAAISRIRSFLPEGVDTQVITGGFDSIPVVVLSVTSDASPQELAARLTDVAAPRLTKVEGVRQVEVIGAPERQVLVRLDAARMASARLTSVQVLQAIGGSGQLNSGGQLDEGSLTVSVTVGKRYASVEDVSAVQIPPTTPGGPPVTLGSVATVELTDKPSTSISRTDGLSSLTLSITKIPDANTVGVSEQVMALLPEIAAQIGEGTQFTTVFDQAPFITQSIDDLLTEGGLGLVAAIVVILVFLLSVRSTLVTAVSIPVSLLVTLIGMNALDYSLNILTLGAITISIGRVVDDSIVVIENINRHLSAGTPKLQAILVAVREVATAITAATITTVAVFLPIALVGGQTGELFRPFALTVTLALMASLVVSLTIVPVLAYWFLKSPTGAEPREHRDWMQRAYVPTITWGLKHPVIVLVAAVLLLGGTAALSTQLKTNFLGDTGQNTLSVTQQFEPALSLAEKDRRTQPVEQALRNVPGVRSVQLTVGNGGNIFFGAGDDQASYTLTTDPEVDQADLQRTVRGVLDGIQGETLLVSAAAAAGTNTINVIITAPDTTRLQQASEAVTGQLNRLQHVSDVKSSLAADRPQISVVLKQPAAANAGLTDAVVSQLLRGALAPATVGQVDSTGSPIDLTLQTATAPVGLAELQQMPIMTAAGPVPLSQVATVTRTSVATSIQHSNGERSVTVTVTPTGDDLSLATNEVNDALAAVTLPEGASTEVGGVAAEQQDAFRQLGLALLAAIAIVYVVMVATFKSLVQPLILAVSIPFAATGALLGLLVTDTPLGIPSLIGLLMLIGIVVTNAIVLIDLVNHYRREGMSAEVALIEGARRRLRPILMTALATIGALTPMALGLSGGGVFISKPLAIVVIGGLLSSTVLTLLLVPVLYDLVIGRLERRAHASNGGLTTVAGADVARAQAALAADAAPRRAATE
nr:efflux RND transporter permease subunit [Tessaracoccus sp. SD287]